MLQTIVALRAVQHTAAEFGAVQAAHHARSLDAETRRMTNLVDLHQEGYRRCLGGTLFNPDVALAWTCGVQHHSAVLHAHEIDQHEAAAKAAHEAKKWRTASHRLDIAESMADRAAHQERRRRDEAQMAIVADRLLHRSAQQ
jgi:hypothetical protein